MNPSLENLLSHRSIRKYKNTPLTEENIRLILDASVRASTTGNMQLYSVILTRDQAKKKDLAAFHFNQPMMMQAPLIMTYCVDLHRFHQWCRLSEAEKSYDNFFWFLNAFIDTCAAAQNACIAAESQGLGICYIGTTVYSTKKIADFFHLPEGVVPLITLTVGHPDENPPLTDRLPLEAVVHQESYQKKDDEQMREIYHGRDHSEETQRLLDENQLPNLAQIFTKKRYTKTDALRLSKEFAAFLEEAGFHF